MLTPWKKIYFLDSILRSREITLPTKFLLVKAMVFPVVMWLWVLDCEESWALKNWWFWIMVLEKTLESLSDCKEIQTVHPKGDQSSVYFGRNDGKAETLILLPPHLKSWLIGKNSDSGRNRGQEEKGRTEDEMAGWHHRLDGHKFEWNPRVGGGQWGLLCYNSWGHNELDTTEWLKWTEVRMINTSSYKLCSIY